MESVYLHGSDDVARAGRNIDSAASTIERAASSFGWEFEKHQRFLDDWLSRFAAEIDRLKATPEGGEEKAREPLIVDIPSALDLVHGQVKDESGKGER